MKWFARRFCSVDVVSDVSPQEPLLWYLPLADSPDAFRSGELAANQMTAEMERLVYIAINPKNASASPNRSPDGR
jgi:hypothetical protein